MLKLVRLRQAGGPENEQRDGAPSERLARAGARRGPVIEGTPGRVPAAPSGGEAATNQVQVFVLSPPPFASSNHLFLLVPVEGVEPPTY